jgi:hypothetical protein
MSGLVFQACLRRLRSAPSFLCPGQHLSGTDGFHCQGEAGLKLASGIKFPDWLPLGSMRPEPHWLVSLFDSDVKSFTPKRATCKSFPVDLKLFNYFFVYLFVPEEW